MGNYYPNKKSSKTGAQTDVENLISAIHCSEVLNISNSEQESFIIVIETVDSECLQFLTITPTLHISKAGNSTNAPAWQMLGILYHH